MYFGDVVRGIKGSEIIKRSYPSFDILQNIYFGGQWYVLTIHEAYRSYGMYADSIANTDKKKNLYVEITKQEFRRIQKICSNPSNKILIKQALSEKNFNYLKSQQENWKGKQQTFSF